MAEEKKYTVDEFARKTFELVGKQVGPPTTPNSDIPIPPYFMSMGVAEIMEWALHGNGDDNPLYTKPEYAAKTRYGCLIAPPTILFRYGYPAGHSVMLEGPYPVTGLLAGTGFEWFDVLKVGTRFRYWNKYVDAYEKKSKLGQVIYTKTEGWYWNQWDELSAKSYGTYSFYAVKPREKMLYERGVHHYSEEEIERIVHDVNIDVRRGDKTLYWEDVKVGDKLTPVLKPPLTIGYLQSYWCALNPSPPVFSAWIREAIRRETELKGGGLITNPVTGWPYESWGMEHFDQNLSRFRGMATNFAEGTMLCSFPYHLLSNWMGDDGFIRRMDTQVEKPLLFGDALWIKGEVVKKYMVTEKGPEEQEKYGAVDIKYEGKNQIGENTTPGTATVYLPSRGKPVKLPIPHEPVPPKEWYK